MEGSKFLILSRVECQAFVDGLIKNYSLERDLDSYFSREAMEGLMIDSGKNWKECLLDFDIKVNESRYKQCGITLHFYSY